MRTITRTLVGCLVACLSMWSCSAARGPMAVPAAVGINSDITWGLPKSDIQTEVTLMRYAGVRWIRTSVDLSGAERSGPGRLSRSYLRHVDDAVRAARSAGLKVLMEFDRTPYWASADPSRHSVGGRPVWRPYWTYRDPQDYARIVGDLVRRYAPMGVSSFELWNEPNNPRFWPSGPDPAAYVSLLRAADRRVKLIDPKAIVVTGGLMPAGALGYLRGLYRAGARGFFDVAGFHLYPAGAPTGCTPTSFCLIEALHSTMLANGDGSPVWITEFGWSTCDRTGCVSRRQQEDYVAAAYRMLARPQYQFVRLAFVYQFRDLIYASSNAAWESGLGLVDRRFDPKPAYGALEAAAQHAPWRRPGGGSISLRLATLTRLVHHSHQRIAVLASGVARGASRAQVLIVVQRWVKNGWGTARVRIRPLGRAGAYWVLMRLGPGLWRVRTFDGTGLSTSRVMELA